MSGADRDLFDARAFQHPDNFFAPGDIALNKKFLVDRRRCVLEFVHENVADRLVIAINPSPGQLIELSYSLLGVAESFFEEGDLFGLRQFSENPNLLFRGFESVDLVALFLRLRPEEPVNPGVRIVAGFLQRQDSEHQSGHPRFHRLKARKWNAVSRGELVQFLFLGGVQLARERFFPINAVLHDYWRDARLIIKIGHLQPEFAAFVHGLLYLGRIPFGLMPEQVQGAD